MASTTPGGRPPPNGCATGSRALNIDYRSSLGEFPGAMLPIVSTYPVGAGPFAGDATRIKQRRIGWGEPGRLSRGAGSAARP